MTQNKEEDTRCEHTDKTFLWSVITEWEGWPVKFDTYRCFECKQKINIFIEPK